MRVVTLFTRLTDQQAVIVVPKAFWVVLYFFVVFYRENTHFTGGWKVLEALVLRFCDDCVLPFIKVVSKFWFSSFFKFCSKDIGVTFKFLEKAADLVKLRFFVNLERTINGKLIGWFKQENVSALELHLIYSYFKKDHSQHWVDTGTKGKPRRARYALGW